MCMGVFPIARRQGSTLSCQDCRRTKDPDGGALKIDCVESHSVFTQVLEHLFFVEHGAVRPNEHITVRVNDLQCRVVMLLQRPVKAIGVESKHFFWRHCGLLSISHDGRPFSAIQEMTRKPLFDSSLVTSSRITCQCSRRRPYARSERDRSDLTIRSDLPLSAGLALGVSLPHAASQVAPSRV